VFQNCVLELVKSWYGLTCDSLHVSGRIESVVEIMHRSTVIFD
jgi:hypothetical protein